MAWRLLLAVPAAVVLLLMNAGDPGFDLAVLSTLTPTEREYLQLAIATPTVLWCAWPFLARAAASVRSGRLNAFTLIVAAIGTAYVVSVVAVLAPQVLPPSMHDPAGPALLLFDTAVLITTIVLLGQIIEAGARALAGGPLPSMPDPPAIQTFADACAWYVASGVLLIGTVALVAWLIAAPAPVALDTFVAVLIVANPRAFGLAAPVAMMVAGRRGARAGILSRPDDSLARMATADTMVVDKTGTVTEGKPRVIRVEGAGGLSGQAVLGLAAAVETGSDHPVAAAIVAAARQNQVAGQTANEIQTTPGKGAAGTVDGQRVLVGSHRLMDDARVSIRALSAAAAGRCSAGEIVVFVAVDGGLAGIISLRDTVRSSAEATIANLRKTRMKVVLATGDGGMTADALASGLGLDGIHAGLLPGDKARLVTKLRSTGRGVAAVGHGACDAPALAAADVGIAIGPGAIGNAWQPSITLAADDASALVRARRLAMATMRNARQSLGLAFVYNGLAVPVAAGVLYPAFGFMPSPIAAAVAMSVPTLAVTFNALRLGRASL